MTKWLGVSDSINISGQQVAPIMVMQSAVILFVGFFIARRLGAILSKRSKAYLQFIVGD